MRRVRDLLLFRAGRLRVAVWNVWWWFHSERGGADTTFYVGPFVVHLAAKGGQHG